ARSVVRGEGGSITLNANEFTAINGGRLVGGIETTGNAGNILVNTNRINLTGTGSTGIGAGVYQDVLPGAIGNTGNIDINTRSLSITSGGQIGIQIRAGGTGNAGKISIRADSVMFDGIDLNDRRSGVFSSVYAVPGVTENRIAGDITIDANSVALTNGSGIVSNVEAGAVGQGGNIVIAANSLNLTNGAQIQAAIQESSSTSAQLGTPSRAGNIYITLSGAFTATGIDGSGFPSGVITGVNNAVGSAGNIEIQVDSLSFTNGAQLTSATYGSEATGTGGDIDIAANSLSFTNGARIEAATYGQGNAGKINIRANDAVVLDGMSIDGDRSGIFSSVYNSSGFMESRIAGDIAISAGSLTLKNGALVSSNIEAGAVGESGNILIRAASLTITNGSQIQALLRSSDSASGLAGAQGSAGNIQITLSDTLTATTTDSSDFPSGIVTEVGTGAVGTGGNMVLPALW
ncbi:MAG TPA: hypothetical protein V6C65_00895, partial [Allocoleopsis sp.]